jgi:hypothetical protein
VYISEQIGFKISFHVLPQLFGVATGFPDCDGRPAEQVKRLMQPRRLVLALEFEYLAQTHSRSTLLLDGRSQLVHQLQGLEAT